MIPLIPVDVIAGEMARHLWTVSLQAGVLALFALLAERLFRNAPPGFRYWLWMLVVIRLAMPVDFALPFGMRGQVRDGVEAMIEHLQRRDIPAAPTVTARSITDNPVPGAAPAFTPLPMPAPPAHRQFPAKTVLTVWAGISALLLAAMLTQYVLFRWRLRNSRPVFRLDYLALIERLRRGIGLRRVILMRDDAGLVHAPAVTGVLRPRVWLPGPIVDTWSSDELEPVLLHELAHVKRHDLLVNRLQMLVQALWFFHPLLWLANHRIRCIREEICDDLAIASLRSGRERYALSMVRVGEEIVRRRGFAFAGAGFSERKSSLGARVRRIMDGRYSPHRKMSAGTATALMMVVALGAALACERPEKKMESDVAAGIINDAENPPAPVIQLGGGGKNGRMEAESVLVTLNGKALAPGTDYIVDYRTGEVAILSKDAQNPMSSIEVQYKVVSKPKRDLFGRTKTPPELLMVLNPLSWNPGSRKFEPRPGSPVWPDLSGVSNYSNGKRIEVSIENNGTYRVDGQPVKREALARTLRKKLSGGKEFIVVKTGTEIPGEAIKYLRDLPLTDARLRVPTVSDPDNSDVLISRAADLMVAGRLEESDGAFRDFITRFPKSSHVPRAEYYRAFCAYNLRRFHDAVRLYGTVISAYPDSVFIPEALFYRADSDYNLGNFAEAVRGFDELIARFPESPKAEEGMFTKAWALLDIGRERESVETLRTLVEKYPRGRFAASSLFGIGSYQYNSGNFERAREALTELLERYPDSPVASKARDMLRALEKTHAR